jgi:hypothetical protein
LVHPWRLVFNGTHDVRYLSIQNWPEVWAQWQGSGLIGSPYSDLQRVPGPFLTSLSFTVGSNIAASILWEMYNPVPRLVTVDFGSIARTFIAKTAKSDLSDEEKRSQGSIILTTPAVIAGAEDITEAVRKGLVK